MKNLLYCFTLSLALLTSILSASAQSAAYVGYCNGTLANGTEGRITGLSGENAVIDLAIRLPQNLLSSFAGCKISGVHFGCPEAATYPGKMDCWLRSERDGENLNSGNATINKSGWHSMNLSKPYTVTGKEKELWIGVTYTQATKLNILSFAGESSEDGCWVGRNGSWSNYASKNWGSLALEAIIEGEVPTHNIALVNLTLKDSIVKIGDPIEVKGAIKNLASETAVNPIIAYSLNGTKVGEYTLNSKIAYGETKEFTINVPTKTVTEDITANITLDLKWADGTVDDGPVDNVAVLTTELVKEFYYRPMVVEEGTGSWCGWCVRGIVGLREMKAAYPERFIGIAIHNADTYTVSEYDSWIGGYISGYPSCLINREKKEYDPNFAAMNDYMKKMKTYTNAGLDFYATYANGKITFQSKARFLNSMTSTDYRVVYVIIENQLTLSQKNFYADGARGEMGGFESLPSPCVIKVDEVARGVYPSVGGNKGAIPAKVERGVGYAHHYTATMPKYNNADNVEAVALLVDGRTGEIVQAAKTPYVYGLNAEMPESIEHTTYNSEPLNNTTYDLSGRQVTNKAKGQIYIQGRKLMLGK